MHILDFDYELPPELIAHEPARPRDSARMMVLNRTSGRWFDSIFRRLPEFLQPSDVLVLNDTRVIRARISGALQRNGEIVREVEVLFAAPAGPDTWEVMCKPSRRIREGDRIVFSNGKLEGEFGEAHGDGLRLLVLHSLGDSLESFLEKHGHVPLPPYIHRKDTSQDAVDYQTIYASVPGAVAAPTAGLHFSNSVLHELRGRGVEILKITLHVGIGTFMPVRIEDPQKHMLKPERFEMTEYTATRLNTAREEGRRIVAVGTTTTRTLEYIVQQHGRFESISGQTDLFILPGYKFKAVDAMVTNFHLPQSTLIMLVSAFASRHAILSAYGHAVQERYRFYSYGDCMLII
jgi:S-adenosylmethionine:tRNA ribosyltransferase-isomerase